MRSPQAGDHIRLGGSTLRAARVQNITTQVARESAIEGKAWWLELSSGGPAVGWVLLEQDYGARGRSTARLFEVDWERSFAGTYATRRVGWAYA